MRRDKSPKNLVIFFHGFPDSWALWRDYIEFPDLTIDAWLIALDLPGHGGSDSLQDYDPDTFLDSIVNFVIAMRGRYLPQSHQESKIVIAGHDWGAIVAFRLAVEAPQLADHFLVCNSVLVSSLSKNSRFCFQFETCLTITSRASRGQTSLTAVLLPSK